MTVFLVPMLKICQIVMSHFSKPVYTGKCTNSLSSPHLFIILMLSISNPGIVSQVTNLRALTQALLPPKKGRLLPHIIMQAHFLLTMQAVFSILHLTNPLVLCKPSLPNTNLNSSLLPTTEQLNVTMPIMASLHQKPSVAPVSNSINVSLIVVSIHITKMASPNAISAPLRNRPAPC